MSNTFVKGYSIVTPYDKKVSQLVLHHTFVLSDAGNNWNCFGDIRNKMTSGVIPIDGAEGFCNARWASLIYGENEGKNCEFPAAGLKERYDGVCHNVANRLLVLAGVDVSNAPGNEYATILYGKYGFGIEQYINRLKQAACEVNRDQPGAISDVEIERVISKIENRLADELNILSEDCEEQLQISFSGCDDSLRKDLFAAYVEFDKKRLAAFSFHPDEPAFNEKYCMRLRPALVECLHTMAGLLNQEDKAVHFEKYLKRFF
jgi:hypothetical protein